MSLITERTLILAAAFLFLVGCTSEELEDIADNYPGDQMVAYGVVHPKGCEIQLSRTISPGLNFFDSDLIIRDNATVTLLSEDSLFVRSLRFDESKACYFYQGKIPDSLDYRVTILHPEYPTLSSPLLSMPNRINTTLDFGEIASTAEQNVPFSSITSFTKGNFLAFQAIVEEGSEPPLGRRSSPFIFFEFDDLFASECGIVRGGRGYTAFSTRCFPSNTIGINASVFYSNSFSSGGRPFRGSDPKSVGLRIGTISEADFNFFNSLRRNQNLLDDLLSREPLTISNVSGGFGYIFAFNSEEFWVEL